MNTQLSRPTLVRDAKTEAVLNANTSFCSRMELSIAELEQAPLMDWIHPDDRELLEGVVAAGEGRATARHRTGTDDWVKFHWHIRIHDDATVAMGREVAGDGSAADVADRAASAYRSLDQTLEAMALIVEAKNPGHRCSILLTDAAHERVTVGAGPSLPVEYNAAVEGLRIGPVVGSCGTAAYWNVPVIVENIAEDPLWKDLRDAAAIAGVAACWSHPITSTTGSVLGAMALYSDVPCAPTRSQMDGLEIAARMVGLAVDRDHLEDALSHAAKMKALGVLAGGVAHDFNNLLAAVMGNAELAKAELPAESPARARLEDIVRASRSATDLCTQLLAYAGRGGLSRETIDLNTVVGELAGLLQVAVSKSTSLDQDLHTEPVGVLADRSQLRQVLLNLINNAAEAIGDGAGRIVIATDVVSSDDPAAREELRKRGLPDGEFSRMRITDTGTGMSEETQAQIFDPFFTTKATGSGLGLAAVHGIVERHRGAISLSSELGEGTTFEVLLPNVPLTRELTAEHGIAAVDGTGLTVLVVDDEPLVLAVHGDQLLSAGYSVIRAGGGDEAIEQFEKHRDAIDCVLLDYSMPGKNGEAVFDELRALRADVRVVLTSGFAEQGVRDRLRHNGFAGFVSKPASMEELLAVISSVTTGGGSNHS